MATVGPDAHVGKAFSARPHRPHQLFDVTFELAASHLTRSSGVLFELVSLLQAFRLANSSSPRLTLSSGVLFELVCSLLRSLSGPDTLVPHRLAPGGGCCQDHPRERSVQARDDGGAARRVSLSFSTRSCCTSPPAYVPPPPQQEGCFFLLQK